MVDIGNMTLGTTEASEDARVRGGERYSSRVLDTLKERDDRRVRDMFAAEALGPLVAPNDYEARPEPEDAPDIARLAYDIADAMMAERARRDGAR